MMTQPHEITFADGTVGAFVELHEHNTEIARLTAERDAWKAVAEELAGEVLDRHGENASSCSPAFAAHEKLKGDV